MGSKRKVSQSLNAPYVKADYHNLSERGKSELIKYIKRICEDEEREMSRVLKKSSMSRGEVISKYFSQNGTYGLVAHDDQSTKFWIDVPKKPKTIVDARSEQDSLQNNSSPYGSSGLADRRTEEEGAIPANGTTPTSQSRDRSSYQADEDRNAEFELSESVPFYDRSVDSHLKDSEANEEEDGGRKASRCFNCGSYSHSLRACQRPRDGKAISKNKSEYMQSSTSNRDSQGENQVRYFNTSAEEFERKETIKNTRRQDILCPLLDGIQPGKLTKELCAALDISFERRDPPPWLARMKELGVPPSYQGKKEITFHGVNAPIPEGSDEYMWNRALRTQTATQDAPVQSTSRPSETAVLRSETRRYEYSSPPEPIDHYRGDARGRPPPIYSDTYGRRPFPYEGAGDGRVLPQSPSVGQSYYDDRIPGLSPPGHGSPYYNSPMQPEVYGDSPNWLYGEPARRNTPPNPPPNPHMLYPDVRQQPMMTPPGLDYPMPNNYPPQHDPRWVQRDNSHSFYRNSTY